MSKDTPAQPDESAPAAEPAPADLPAHGQPTETVPAPAEPEAEPDPKSK